MAIQDIIQCLAVTGSLIALLVVPFLFLASFLTKKKEWPIVLLGAMTLGCSVQAVSGLLWSHIVKAQPLSEVMFFLVLCIVLTLFGVYLQRYLPEENESQEKSQGHGFLLFILIIAFCIRSIHPLQTFALGQSDAYTHLHYLHYIVEQGYLANVVYPSGYHWLLALPVLVFKIDPFIMARFCGAFFGTGLVLAIYVFLYKLFDRKAAILGSFCAAAFPGMILLMKTGVGSFANQFGLFLVPCLLYCYASLIRKDKNLVASFLFPVAALGLAASVPMMLIHVLIIIGVERIFSVFKERKEWFLRTVRVLIFCLPPILLIAFHFNQAGPGQRFQTAQILTDYGEQDKAVTEKVLRKVDSIGTKFVGSQKEMIEVIVGSPYLRLIIDFLSVKRMGFSNKYIDSMAWVLFGLFGCCIVYGVYGRNVGFLILGLWGGLTVIQAATGYLQFSSYQREGWSLLVATCCLSGVLSGLLYKPFEKYLLAKAGILVFMVLSVYLTVQHPPVHPSIQSSAEDLLIRTVRFLGDKGSKLTEDSIEKKPSFYRLSPLLDKSLPVILVSRKFVGWNNQGELVPNVLPPNSRMKTLLVNPRQRNGNISFIQENQYVVFIDKEKRIKPAEMTSAFAMVSPELVKGVLRQQKFLYRANSNILEYIKSLDVKKWQINKVDLSSNLISYVIIPANSRQMEQM